MAENQAGIKRGFRYDKENARMELYVDGIEMARIKENYSSPSGNNKEWHFIGHAESATAGARQGAMFIEQERTTAMTTSDGNFDTGLKVDVKNSAASSSDYVRTRGFQVSVKADSDGDGSHTINGAYITAEAESGTTIAGDVIATEVHAKNNGTASGNVMCLRVYDESQSGTGTNYAISIDCTNNSAFTREYCVHINSGASSGWTNGITFDGNITNTFDFADNDGTNGAVDGTSLKDSGGNDILCDGYIKVDVAGATHYIPLYDTLNS